MILVRILYLIDFWFALSLISLRVVTVLCLAPFCTPVVVSGVVILPSMSRLVQKEHYYFDMMMIIIIIIIIL
jgi:hypothetical protein